MNFSIAPSDVLAALALVLSAYATWTTVRFNKRQNTFIDNQERLNRRLLEKEETALTKQKEADLTATFIRLAGMNYLLRIWNDGLAAAHDVQLEFPDGNDCININDIQSKFPLEVLEPNHAVDLPAAVSMDTKLKHTIKIRWSDARSTASEKMVYPTL